MPTIKAKLVAIEDDVNGYVQYAFENLEPEDVWSKYIMVTRYPNWDLPALYIGDIGYVKFTDILAGYDKWYDAEADDFVSYRYTMSVLEKFIPDKPDADALTRL